MIGKVYDENGEVKGNLTALNEIMVERKDLYAVKYDVFVNNKKLG